MSPLKWCKKRLQRIDNPRILECYGCPAVFACGGVSFGRNDLVHHPRRRAGSSVSAIAARHLAATAIENDVSYRSLIAFSRIEQLGFPDDHPGAIERFNQLVDVDAFQVQQPIVCAEILDGEVHPVP